MVNDIIFCLCVFDMVWHEGLRVGIYNGGRSVRGENGAYIKMQRVLCVCVKDEKSWNIEPNYIKKYLFFN